MIRLWPGRAARGVGCVAFVCAGCLLVACGQALGAPSWLPAADLSATGREATLPQVAVDRQGDATVVWERDDGANTIVQAAVRPAGGVWHAPVDLSAPGQNAFDAQVAVDAQGDATAVWDRFNGSNYIVQSASRPSGGVWQAPVDLSVAGGDAVIPQVALDANGDATAVWIRSNGTNDVVQTAIRPAGGVWQATVDLSVPGQEAREPRIAVNAHGEAAAVWRRSDGANTIVQGAIRPAGGVWQAPVDLSATGQKALGPQVAIDPQGDATAVWQRPNGTNTIVQAATLPAGGVWQAPIDLSAVGQDAFNPELALDAQGNGTAIWQRSNGATYIVQAATHAASGLWQPPVDLSVTGQNADLPQVALDAHGNAVAVWQRFDGTADVIQSSIRPAGGTRRAPVDLAAPGQNAVNPQIALDLQSDATVVWQRFNATNYIVQAAGYDAAGPQLRGASIPASGTAGVPVSFSVSPLDVWSPLASTSWSFGDGGSAAGAAVSHTYAASGTYAVVLSSADTLANSTSATASIAIAPAFVAPSAPALSNVTQTHRRWREGSGKATLTRRRARKPPIGTRFAFTVDQTVRVELTFTQRVHRRTLTRGTLGYLARQGSRRLAFQGRIGNRRLPLGAYTLLMTAVNTATGLRSRTQTLRFVIVR